MAHPKLRHKADEWLRRYLPAEIIATGTAITGAMIGHHASGSLAVAAIAGTIGENIGYYGYFGITETRRHYRGHGQYPPFRRLVLTAVKTVRDMMVEFGPAEFLDSFVFRPLFMYLGPQVVHSFAFGILLGKVAADIIFYTFAIIGYELRKRWA
jgi:hypothetical protein